MKSHWTKKQKTAFWRYYKKGWTLAYWCSDQFGRPCNGGTGPAVTPLEIQTETGGSICEPGTLHATLLPHRWKGSRVWIVALENPVSDGGKFGAKQRAIIGEIYPEEAINGQVGARVGSKNLAGADLDGACLAGADLGGADLRGACLRGADLAGAYLGGAEIGATDLAGADLGGAYLRGAYRPANDLPGWTADETGCLRRVAPYW